MSNLNLNNVVLAGRLTADPELKLTATGVSVTSFSLAVSRSARIVNNERVVETDFITCVAWRKTAEFITKYFKKGSALCVTGSIQTRSWTDDAGQKHYSTEVLINEAKFVDSKVGSSDIPEEAPETLEEVKDGEDLPF